jgi:hypothetical protein
VLYALGISNCGGADLASSGLVVLLRIAKYCLSLRQLATRSRINNDADDLLKCWFAPSELSCLPRLALCSSVLFCEARFTAAVYTSSFGELEFPSLYLLTCLSAFVLFCFALLIKLQ